MILLIVQYKYSKSCSLQHLIIRTRLCGTGFITQPSCAPRNLTRDMASFHNVGDLLMFVVR